MNHVVEKSVVLRAPPSEVWDALTNPDATEQFFFKSRVYSTWKPGSPIVFERRILGILPFRLRGTITSIAAGRQLQYRLMHYKLFGEPGAGEFSVVTDTLHDAPEGTRLSIVDDVGTSPGAERRYERSMKGWDTILSGLERYLSARRGREANGR